jgi:NhaP-type Na+/H+ or K+/H+ antiporter
VLLGLTAILVLGVGAQWLAWRLRLPSILLLLGLGFLAGPVCWYLTDRFLGPGRAFYLNPDAIFGQLLLPLVSLSVALILFEGGLSLNVRELSEFGSVVRNLVSAGAVVTWVVTAAAARWVVGLDARLGVLLGAILVVTGPTVIGPLLRHVRPAGPVGPILRWEGIVIDPIGAMFAVLVFEAMTMEQSRLGAGPLLLALLKITAVGCAIGFAAARVLTVALRKFWVPDHLQNPVTLMFVAAAFQASNLVQPESGLFTVVLMGIVLANQASVPVRQIVEFKESLSVLLVSGLFIVLAARIELWFFRYLSGRTALFVLILVLVARPLAVLVSTVGSGLRWREKLFLSWMAPRGIVAAAVASLFALRLAEAGMKEAELLVPLTFLVIASTVILYASTAGLLARRLGLVQPATRGFLLVGANAPARLIGGALQAHGYTVLLADVNRDNVAAARLAGLPAVAANVLSPAVTESLQLSGIGRLLALTPSDDVNSLAALHFAKLFGRSSVFQLDPGDAPSDVPGDERGAGTSARPRPGRRGADREGTVHELRGRVLFAQGLTFARLAERVEAGAAIQATKLTEDFDFNAFRRLHGDRALPLFVLEGARGLTVLGPDAPAAPRPGATLISLIEPSSPEVSDQISAAGSRRAAAA